MLAGLCLLFLTSYSNAQVRETALYIDNGSGDFAKLIASSLSAGHSFSLPDPGAGNATFALTTGGGAVIFNGPTATRTFTLPDNDGTILTTTNASSNTVMYSGSNSSLTSGGTDLFNVSYAASPGTTTAGAVINSTSSGTNVSATGLTVTAGVATTGGSVTAISGGATGGGSASSNATLGVVGLANTSSFTVPITGQSAWANTSSDFEGGGAAVVGYNITDADNQFAGYFYGNKTDKSASQATGVLTAVDDIRSAIDGTTNAQPAAGEFRLYDNYKVAHSGYIAAPVAMYAEAYSKSDNSEVIGSFSHAWNTANDGGTAAAGAVGALAYGYGSSAAAGLTGKVAGSVGFAGATGTSNYNMIGVEGATQPYGGTTASPISTGGYFFGQKGTTNIGLVGQVGGSINEGWQEGNSAITGGDLSGKLSGMNVAVAAINYNTASSTNLAAYFGGNVEMKDGHITSKQTTVPTISTNDATHITGLTLSNATDVAGKISFSTDGSAVGNDYVQVTFNTSYGTTPIVVIAPGSPGALDGKVYVVPAAGNFALTLTGDGPGGVNYTFYYHVIETQ